MDERQKGRGRESGEELDTPYEFQIVINPKFIGNQREKRRVGALMATF